MSTSPDQTPLAPGNKVSDMVRGGRRVARFVSDVPVHPRFSVLSARYAAKHRKHARIHLAVYYHPAHAWNVDRMLDALAASLDYYQASFGPYPFDQARVVEFPSYHEFAQAFPGTIPYSETVGFISDFDDPDQIDYVAYLTAHETAHQYWAHQVEGAFDGTPSTPIRPAATQVRERQEADARRRRSVQPLHRPERRG